MKTFYVLPLLLSTASLSLLYGMQEKAIEQAPSQQSSFSDQLLSANPEEFYASFLSIPLKDFGTLKDLGKANQIAERILKEIEGTNLLSRKIQLIRKDILPLMREGREPFDLPHVLALMMCYDEWITMEWVHESSPQKCVEDSLKILPYLEKSLPVLQTTYVDILNNFLNSHTALPEAWVTFFRQKGYPVSDLYEEAMKEKDPTLFKEAFLKLKKTDWVSLTTQERLDKFCEKIMDPSYELFRTQEKDSLLSFCDSQLFPFMKHTTSPVAMPHALALMLSLSQKKDEAWFETLLSTSLPQMQSLYPKIIEVFLKNLTSYTNFFIQLEKHGFKPTPEQWVAFLEDEYAHTKFQPTLYFTNIPGSKEYRQMWRVSWPQITMYANEDGYLTNYEESNLQKSTALTLPDGTPIGYTIYVNKNELPSQFLIQVYGGSNRFNSVSPYQPTTGTSLHHALMNGDWGVITLNLPDHLKTSQAQRQQEKEVYTMVQEGIHTFVDKLRKDPGFFHSALAPLSNQPLKLAFYGASYGGGRAVKYAASPYGKEDFQFYISHDGALDYATNELAKNYYLSAHKQDVKHGTVTNSHISFNEEDFEKAKANDAHILILQNLDDNTVRPEAARQFYEKARRAGIAVELKFFKTGNPIPDQKEWWNKGHFSPDGTGDGQYTDIIRRFLKEGPKPISYSEARALKYSFYSPENSASASPEERFRAEAFRRYQKALLAGNSPLTHLTDPAVWAENYEPLYIAFAFLDYVRQTPDHLPLAKEVVNQGMDDEEKAEDAIGVLLDTYLPFIKEFYNLKIPPDLDRVALQKALAPKFAGQLLVNRNRDKSGFEHFFFNLRCLILAHPELVIQYADPSLVQKWREETQGVKDRFIQDVITNEKLQENKELDKHNMAYAIQDGNLKMIRGYLDRGATLTLKDAILSGHPELVEEVLKKEGPDVNQVRKYECTPLTLAVSQKKFTVVKLLVENGADPTKMDGWGKTAIHEAVSSKQNEVLKFFKESGFNLTVGDENGDTPLHLAVERDNIEAIKLLIEGDNKESGFNLTIANQYGDTPLHIAAQRDRIEAIKVLIEKGNNKEEALRRENNRKYTPFELAKSKEAERLLATPEEEVQ